MLTKQELDQWCTELENHPERQHTGSLTNCDGTKFCCLGQLAMLHGAVIDYSFVDMPLLSFDGDVSRAYLGDDWVLTKHLGLPADGLFRDVGMPNLMYEGNEYRSASEANDGPVPWPVIAAHFRQHYPAV